ncbi:MAG: hypothetical protein IPM48_01825 [Saprospiraceae bacterium]|nr:hypothetical protein [Saprospiraceae bacterium]
MIASAAFDQTIIQFENKPKEAERLLDKIEAEHELLLDILVGTNAESLTDDEADYLIFLFAALFETIRREKGIKEYDQKQIEDAEEKAWEIINEQKDFEKSVEKLYEISEEKDAVEFIELSLGPDDENEYNITDTGRLIMLAVLAGELMVFTD